MVFELSNILDRLEDAEAPTDHVHYSREEQKHEALVPLRSLSPVTTARVAALSRSLRPYRYLTDSGDLTPAPLSPERAQLLASLVAANVDMLEVAVSGADFSSADLMGAVLTEAALPRVNLQNADLRNADLGLSVLSGTILRGADLRGADLRHAFLFGTNVTTLKAHRSNADPGNFIPPADLTDARLDGARVCGPDWFDEQLQRPYPPMGLDAAQWTIVPTASETYVLRHRGSGLDRGSRE